MLKIRFTRTGKKNQPHYRIVVIEHWRKPKGKCIETLGSYNPRSKEAPLKKERILYWLSVGAKCSPTVHNLLISQKIIKGSKQKASTAKKQQEKPIDKKTKDDKIETKVETKT
ncbi:MAG: 30S ribosomal protein S16 [bacterium]